MPNHVTTVLTVTGPEEQIAAFEAAHIRIAEDKHDGDAIRVFDFRTIVPQPACVDGTESGTMADVGFYALTGLLPAESLITTFPQRNPILDGYAGFRPKSRFVGHAEFAEHLAEVQPQALELGRRSVACFRETGFRDWYGWNCANWGTKWGAYDYEPRSREPGRLVIKFETAWSVPEPIFDALAKLYPSMTFGVESVDEGGPEYVGLWHGDAREFKRAEHDADRYRRVMGRDPYRDDDDESEDAAEVST